MNSVRPLPLLASSTVPSSHIAVAAELIQHVSRVCSKRCARLRLVAPLAAFRCVCVCCRGSFRQPAPVIAPRHCRRSPKQELRENFAAVYDNEQG
jgi:hypothetical protein